MLELFLAIETGKSCVVTRYFLTDVQVFCHAEETSCFVPVFLDVSSLLHP
jgi:hypothetical protein